MDLEILVPISLFAVIGVVVYFTSKYSYQTKKAIIEKGGNIEFKKRRFPFMEFGTVLTGLAVGLAISVIPQSSGLPDDAKGLLVAACILLFTGLGFVSAYFIRKKFEGDKN